MNDTNTPATRPSWPARLAKGGVLVAALAVGLAAAQLVPSHAAFAAGEPGGHHAGMHERHRARLHDHLQRVLADVGASEAQRQKIEAIVKASMEDQRADMERMHADMKLLKQLLTAPTLDTAKITTVRAEQEQLAAQASRRLVDTAVAVAQQLTPQQRAALGKEIDAMFARHHAPFGGGARHGRPEGE